MREIDIINNDYDEELDPITRAEIDNMEAYGGKKFNIPMDQQEDGLHINVDGTEYVINRGYDGDKEVWTARTDIDPRILEADNWRTIVNKCVIFRSMKENGYYDQEV